MFISTRYTLSTHIHDVKYKEFLGDYYAYLLPSIIISDRVINFFYI